MRMNKIKKNIQVHIIEVHILIWLTVTERYITFIHAPEHW